MNSPCVERQAFGHPSSKVRTARRRARAWRILLRPEALEERVLLSVTAPPNTYGLIENTPFQVAAPGVLANASDTTATLLHVSSSTQPSHGTLVLNANGSFVYTPAANYFGPDSFTYVVSDGAGGSATSSVSLNVTQQGSTNASIVAGARLASVSTTQSSLLNPLLTSLLGPGANVNLTVVDWNALAGSQIDGGKLIDQLQTNLGVASPSQVLTSNITLSQLLVAEAQVAQADGDTAAATVLNNLSVTLQPVTGTIQLGNLFTGSLNNGDLTGVSLNALDLLTGSTELFNSSNVASTPQPITLSGSLLSGLGLPASVGSALLYAQVVEPPVFTSGPAGTTFHTADIRLKLDLNNLVGLNLDTSGLLAPILALIPGASVTANVADLGVYIEVGSASGTIQSINAVTDAVTLQATPSVGSIYIGQIADSVFWDRTHVIDPTTDLTPGTIGTLTVTSPTVNLSAGIQLKDFSVGAAPVAGTLNFSPPYPQTQTDGSSSTAVTALLGGLTTNLQLGLSGNLGVLQPIANTLVTDLAAPVVAGIITPIVSPLLTGVVDPMLQTLGVGIGEAVINVDSVQQLSAPIANADFANTTEGGTTQIPVLNNDAFVTGDTIAVTSTTNPAHGTLVVNSNGTISYTPTAGFLGQDTFSYTITDEHNGLTSVTPGTVSINVLPDVSVLPPALAALTVNSPTSQQLTATGGNGGPYTFGVTTGTLPAGLTLDPNSGLITGTPTTAGPYSFTVTATDSVGDHGAQAYTGTVNAAILVAPPTQPAMTVGSPFHDQETATGGSGGPYTFAVTAGALPVGLTLDPTTGLITGTPTTAGPYTFTITATASGGDTGAQPYSGTVNGAIVVNPVVLPATTVGSPFHDQETATGGSGGPYTFAVTAGALPAGLTLDSATGQITGTPTTAGPYTFTITATATGGDTGSEPYSGTVNPAITVAPPAQPAMTVGSPFHDQETATGGTGGPYTFAVTAGALPAGLALNSTTGLITGTPTTAGPYTFTITATATGGDTGSEPYTGTVHGAILVAPPVQPAMTVGSPFHDQETATGGSGGPYTFAVTTGTLPSGLTLDPTTGLITGTPTTAGPYTFTITATATGGDTGSEPYSGTVNGAIAVAPTTLPTTTVGSPFHNQETATGGSGGPYTFGVTTGTLPSGLTLNPTTGLITGTPTTAGPYSFTITATASGGDTGSQPYNGTVNPAITVSPPALPATTVGSPFHDQETATGGSGGPYTFAVTAGALPAGLTLDPTTGLITGTPTTAGPYTVTITATGSGGDTGSEPYSGTVNSAIAISPPILPTTTVGSPFHDQETATGGSGGPYTFGVTTGTLPAGLTLNPATGQITGTPTTAGPYTFTITATASGGDTGAQPYSGTVNAAIVVSPSTQPIMIVGDTFHSQETATGGGGGPYTFGVTTGTLPAGLTLNPTTGQIAGTPTTAGPYTFTITATGSGGDTGSEPYSGTVNPAVAVAPATLPALTVGSPFQDQETATGGHGGPYTFAVGTGTLPAGLTLNPTTGQITGTPTTAGPYSFTVKATDSGGDTGSQPYAGTVNTAIVVSPPTLPTTTVGSPFHDQETATGGSGGPYTFTVTTGTLPSGLTLNPTTGQITGTPTTAGPYTFTITATASGGDTGSEPYSGTVNPAITVAPPTLPVLTVGSPFQDQETATGGSGGPYTYTVTTGTLPGGLTLNPTTGQITGTPTTAGSYSFTVTATGSGGDTGSQAYSGPVNVAITINPPVLPPATVTVPYSQQETATGGSGGPYTYTVTAGALPPGLVLDPTTGLISGTPTTAGPYQFTLTATGSGGDTGSVAFQGAVNSASSAPTVVNLQRLGFHDQPTEFVLTFSTALDPASASNLSNYTLSMIVRSRHRVRLQTIALASAIYNPGNDTVTLHPVSLVKLRQEYQLTVNGTPPSGVAGSSGAFLSGQGSGHPGTNYVRTFGPEVLAGPSVNVAALRKDARLTSSRSIPLLEPVLPHAASTVSRAHTGKLSARAIDAVLHLGIGLGRSRRG